VIGKKVKFGCRWRGGGRGLSIREERIAHASFMPEGKGGFYEVRRGGGLKRLGGGKLGVVIDDKR